MAFLNGGALRVSKTPSGRPWRGPMGSGPPWYRSGRDFLVAKPSKIGFWHIWILLLSKVLPQGGTPDCCTIFDHLPHPHSHHLQRRRRGALFYAQTHHPYTYTYGDPAAPPAPGVHPPPFFWRLPYGGQFWPKNQVFYEIFTFLAGGKTAKR